MKKTTLLFAPDSETGATLDTIANAVEQGLGALRTEQKSLRDQITADVGNLDKTSKILLEDITRLKKAANDTDASRAELLKKISLLDARVQMQVRDIAGCPIRRIQGDERMRTKFNAAIRASMDKDGVLFKPFEPKLKALGEDASPGSTLIDDALAAEIYDTLASYGVWNTFGVRNVGTKQTKFPLKSARPVANFVLTESDTVADDTTKAGSSVTLEVEVIAVLLNVSLQLLEDSEFDITADVMADFAEALAYRLDYAAVLGDATADATNGGFTGILNGWTAADAAAGNATIETTELEDWLRVLTTVDPVVLSRACRWWINPRSLVRTLGVKDENGRPIFLTALEAPASGGIGSILGYPVTLAHIMPTTNAAPAKVAAFGDPQSQVIGIRRAFNFEGSDHHKWNTLQRSFRAYGRAGVKTRSATGGAYLKLTA
jgi:HK97 family phage major capsid protein